MVLFHILNSSITVFLICAFDSYLIYITNTLFFYKDIPINFRDESHGTREMTVSGQFSSLVMTIALKINIFSLKEN